MIGAVFALAYAVLTLLGRATALEGMTVSLVWPAAGVAILWLLAESPRRAWRVLVPLMVVHGLVVLATGVSPVVAFFGSLSVTVQTGLVGLLVRRWCPTLLGAGGTASIRSPRSLMATGLAACIGCAVGGLIGPVGLWLDGADVTPLTVLAWFARHVTGLADRRRRRSPGVGVAYAAHPRPYPQRQPHGARPAVAGLPGRDRRALPPALPADLHRHRAAGVVGSPLPDPPRSGALPGLGSIAVGLSSPGTDPSPGSTIPWPRCWSHSSSWSRCCSRGSQWARWATGSTTCTRVPREPALRRQSRPSFSRR